MVQSLACSDALKSRVSERATFALLRRRICWQDHGEAKILLAMTWCWCACRCNMRAVKNNQVVLVDGDQMFNRPGPRLVDALEWLVGLLHHRPEMIPPDFPWEFYKLVQ